MRMYTGWRLRLQLWAYSIAFGAVWLTVIALSQETIPHPKTGPDPYAKSYNFDKEYCCDVKDCQQIVNPSKSIKPEVSGYMIRETGEHVTLNKTGFSPDTNWHICRWPRKEVIRCLLIPNGGA